MSDIDTDFETMKKKCIEQRTESLERLEQRITEALQGIDDSDRTVVALHRARASALAAVERLHHVTEGDLEVATTNADNALRSAYERLDAAVAASAA